MPVDRVVRLLNYRQFIPMMNSIKFLWGRTLVWKDERKALSVHLRPRDHPYTKAHGETAYPRFNSDAEGKAYVAKVILPRATTHYPAI